MSRFSSRGGGGRRDAKQMSKNRFAQLDSDIASNYEDEDDNAGRPQQRTTAGRIMNRLAGAVMHGRSNNKYNKGKDRHNKMSATGVRGETVNKIRVPQGRKFGIPWILKQLNQQIEDLKPLLVTLTQRGDVEFLLKSDDTAQAVRAISRRIVNTRTGERMTLLLETINAPWSRLSKEEVEVINAVVDSRYNEPSRALDLSEFALDPKFKERDFHMLLSKNNVMLTVLDRIDEKYGGITALSLKGNRLRMLDYASMLTSVTKFITVLDLSDNQIDSIAQLSKLKGLPVKTLFFEGNPVCEQLTRSTEYLNAIHQVFPRVIGLDGNEVPACLTPMTDDDDEPSEPTPRPGFYATDEIRQLVETFVVEYFKQYDGENGGVTRKNLIPAYDAENSVFTVSIANLSDSAPIRYHDDSCYLTYVQSSHNILQQDKWRNRHTRSTRGALEIAVQLSKLPITNHYTESFIVDVHLVTPRLLGFSVQGLFEDGKLAKAGQLPTLNYFSRSFMVAPRDEGAVAVLSDMLYISAVLPERMARYRRFINKCVSAGAAAPSTSNPSQPTIGQAVQSLSGMGMSEVPTEEIRKQMVEQFCKDSGMLPEWSLKCLEDSNWNYELAGQQFTAMRANIPREAFANP